MIHVLMISLDSTLVTQPEGDSRRRHIDYAARAGRLTIVVYTPPNVSEPVYPSPELSIRPTNSRHKFTFAVDAVREAKHAVEMHPIDLITSQDPFATGLVGVWLRRRWRIPLLVQNHSFIFGNAAWIAENPLRNLVLGEIGRFVVNQADMYRTVNRKERETYLKMGGSESRSVALPIGTASAALAQPIAEAALEQLRAYLGLAPTHRVILWVGYPVKFKRVPLLFKVFRRVVASEPNTRLVLVGDMARSDRDLPALARAEGIADRVILDGPVAHHELPAYYALADVYVHTSAYEGVPRVLFEASASGLPLVAMSAVGVDEVIEDGVNGYLVPDANIDVMAQRIITLLRDPALARQMGAAARDRAFERYGAERCAEAWVGVWQKAVELGMKPR